LTAGQPVRAFGRYLRAIIGARHGTTILATDVVDRSLSALTRSELLIQVRGTKLYRTGQCKPWKSATPCQSGPVSRKVWCE
jgi:hypothetical protein